VEVHGDHGPNDYHSNERVQMRQGMNLLQKLHSKNKDRPHSP
jgi:hypothetical protein